MTDNDARNQLLELLLQPLPEPRWLVPGMFSNGLHQIQADDASSTSCLALQLAAAVASGGEFLGRPTEQAEVLLVSRNGMTSELRSRLVAQGWDAPPPALRLGFRVRLDADLALALDEYLGLNPSLRLIVIDLPHRPAPPRRREVEAAELADMLRGVDDLARKWPAVTVVFTRFLRPDVSLGFLRYLDGSSRSACQLFEGVMVLRTTERSSGEAELRCCHRGNDGIPEDLCVVFDRAAERFELKRRTAEWTREGR